MSQKQITAIMPHSIECERAVLGSLLLDARKAAELNGMTAADMYDTRHGLILRHVLEMIDAGEAVDLVTVTEHLKRAGEIEKAGGPAYLASLTDGMPLAMNVAEYARICRGKAALRRLAHISQETMHRAISGEEEPGDIAAGVETTLSGIATQEEQGLMPIAEILPKVISQIESARNRNISGVATGLIELDRLMCGLQPASLTIVAARPGQGKTSLCLGIAAHAALRLRKTVLLFTLETSLDEVGEHLLCSLGDVNSHKLRSGFADKEDWRRIMETAANLSECALYLDETAALDISRLRTRSKAFGAKRKADLVIIDYLQLVGAMRKHDTRQGEVAEVSRGLKILAKEMDCAVVAACQLNRRIEMRGGSRGPQLSDLRESGSIEADADAVLFIYRENEEAEGEAQIVVGKNRHGPVGKVAVTWLPEKRRFANAWTGDEKPTDKWWDR